MGRVNRVCLRGRKTSPTQLLLDSGECITIQKETFYPLNESRYWLLDESKNPPLVLKAIRE